MTSIRATIHRNAIMRDYTHIKDIDPNSFTQYDYNYLCRAAIDLNPCALKYIQNQSIHICLFAIGINVSALKYVNDTNKYSVCASLITENWHNIQYMCYAKNTCSNPDHHIMLCLDSYEKLGMLAIGINRSAVTHMHALTPNLIMHYINIDPALIKNITHQTYEACHVAIKKDPALIAHVRELTPDLCELAIRTRPRMIKWMYTNDTAREMITPDLQYLAIDLSPYVIKYMQSYDVYICRKVLERSPFNCKYIKYNNFEGNRNELIKLIEEASAKNIKVFTYIDKDLGIHDKIYRDVVTRHPCALKDIEDQSHELCKLAIEHNSLAIRYTLNQTDDLCRLAIRKNIHVMRFIKNQTDELCMFAIKCNLDSYYYIREPSYAVNLYAVRQRPLFIQRIQEQTPELCKLAVSLDPNMLVYIRKQTYDLCLLAMNKSITTFYYVKREQYTPVGISEDEYHRLLGIYHNHNMQTPYFTCMRELIWDYRSCKTILDLVKYNGMLLKYVELLDIPEDITYYDICLASVKNNGLALRHVYKYPCRLPSDAYYLSEEQLNILAMHAVSNNKLAIKYVHKQTTELCLKAVELSYTLRYIYEQTDDICIHAQSDMRNTTYAHNKDPMKNTFEYRTCVKNKADEVLKYVVNQTEKICINAIWNRCSLPMIKQQTYPITKRAILIDLTNMLYIDNITSELTDVYLTTLMPHDEIGNIRDFKRGMYDLYDENEYLYDRLN